MAKKEDSTYQSICKLIDALCNRNAICNRNLQQSIKGDELGVSEFTRTWFRSKQQAYADERAEFIENAYDRIDAAMSDCAEHLEPNKQTIMAEYKKFYPATTKTFDQLISAYEIIDEDLFKLIESHLEAETTGEQSSYASIYGACESYCKYALAKSVLESQMKVFESYAKDFSYDGYKNLLTFRNVTDTVKGISADVICDFNDLVNMVAKEMPAAEVKQGILLNKLAKKLAKTPNNPDLQEQFAKEQAAYQYLQENIQSSIALKTYVNALYSRFVAANTPKVELGGKIMEALADFGFGVTGELKEQSKPPMVDTVYASTLELANIVSIAKSFPAYAPFIRDIGYEADITLTFPIESFEYSKVVLEYLQQDFVERLAELQKSDTTTPVQQLKTKIIKPEAAKHLLFVSPVGTLMFNGEHCVDIKTGKTISLAELNKYIYDENKQQFFLLKTDEQIKPGSVTIVDEPATGKPEDVMIHRK